MAGERVTVLAGGVGAARLLRGIASLVDPAALTVIVNTADDDRFFGLAVSPDVDTIVYNLAGLAPAARGWGRKGDSSRVLVALAELGGDAWFHLGDLDLATHLYRTDRLARGARLDEVTQEIAEHLGVASRVLPMTNDPVRTKVVTAGGETIAFQEYFVHRRARDRVARIEWTGLSRARPAPGVLDAIRNATILVFPPSNPFTSLLPILGVRGVRDAVARRRAPLVAVSPIRAGRAMRGPLDGMLRAHGRTVSPLALLDLYDGLVDGLVIDPADAALVPAAAKRGVLARAADIDLSTPAKSRKVARLTLALARSIRRSP